MRGSQSHALSSSWNCTVVSPIGVFIYNRCWPYARQQDNPQGSGEHGKRVSVASVFAVMRACTISVKVGLNACIALRCKTFFFFFVPLFWRQGASAAGRQGPGNVETNTLIGSVIPAQRYFTQLCQFEQQHRHFTMCNMWYRRGLKATRGVWFLVGACFTFFFQGQERLL